MEEILDRKKEDQTNGVVSKMASKRLKNVTY